MKQRRIILLLVAVLMQVATFAQHSPDFAEKFMKQHQADSTLKCITVSPKMMEQLVKMHDDNRSDNIIQTAGKEYRTEEQHGIFYTRNDRKGNTVEFIMLCEEPQHDKSTIINLTGGIDNEFLCFLYNKSF